MHPMLMNGYHVQLDGLSQLLLKHSIDDRSELEETFDEQIFVFFALEAVRSTIVCCIHW